MAFQKYLAEFVGTAILVIVGCGSVVVADFGSAGAAGVLAIAPVVGGVAAGLLCRTFELPASLGDAADAEIPDSRRA